MPTDLDATLQWAHRANIVRYRQLLKTRLTPNERESIERQLGEEEELFEIGKKATLLDCATAVGPKTSHAE